MKNWRKNVYSKLLIINYIKNIKNYNLYLKISAFSMTFGMIGLGMVQGLIDSDFDPPTKLYTGTLLMTHILLFIAYDSYFINHIL